MLLIVIDLIDLVNRNAQNNRKSIETSLIMRTLLEIKLFPALVGVRKTVQ